MNLRNGTNYDSIAEIYLSSTDEKPFTKYYERPLHEYLQPMWICKLDLKVLAEPKPSKLLEKKDPEMYTRLLKRSCFLFFILENKV